MCLKCLNMKSIIDDDLSTGRITILYLTPSEIARKCTTIPVVPAAWYAHGSLHYNIYNHCTVGHVTHAHCIVLLYSVGDKTTT